MNFNGTQGASGLDLIRRYEQGEDLQPEQMESMRATMYLIYLYLYPQRAWEGFRWKGPDHFLEEIWPRVKERHAIQSGLFGHGAVSP